MKAGEVEDAQVVRRETDALTTFAGDNPLVGIERARKIAVELRKVVDERGLAVRMGRSEHLLIEAWTALGALCGVFPKTEWTRMERAPDGRFEGCTARVQVVRMATGEEVCAAENACFVEEQVKTRSGDYFHRWVENCQKHREPTLEPCGLPSRHAVVSMAQTRAASKALGQALRWIVELAGYSGTPAEELPGAPAADDGPPQRGSETLTEDQAQVLAERAKERAKKLEGVSAKEIVENVLAHHGLSKLSQVRQVEMPGFVKLVATWDGPLDVKR